MTMFKEQTALVKAQYPNLGEGWSVQMSGWSITELVDSAGEIGEKIDQSLNNDVFIEQAVSEALKQSSIKVNAPEGYLFARLVKEGETPLMVLLKV